LGARLSIRRKTFIVSTLRKRIEHALRARSLSAGDRLPSTREIGSELGADPRVVMAAYQVLAEEGLVEIRPRSGAYVGATGPLTEERVPSPDVLTDALVAGVVRGFSLVTFTDHLRIAALGRRLRATVIAETLDQAHGLARELRVDYGLATTSLLPQQLKGGTPARAALQRSQLLLTTKDLERHVSPIATDLDKRLIVADIRPPFMNEEWRTLLRYGRIYLIAADPRFLAPAQNYLKSLVDLGNLRILIVGSDDLAVIPPQAPTYVTEAARLKLGKTRIPGRLIPPPRLLAEDCVRAIVSFIVHANVDQAGA